MRSRRNPPVGTAPTTPGKTTAEAQVGHVLWPSLDGLRCLAILPVIWHHSTPGALPGLAGKGAAGVDLFFALSGFLITSLLLRERARSGRVHLRLFYARRAIRIFPLYYAVLALYVLYAVSFAAPSLSRAHFFENLLYHATYTANWFADLGAPHPVLFAFSWSLCVEEQFYLVWPVLIALVPGRVALSLLMAGGLTLDMLAEAGLLTPLLPASPSWHRVATSFAPPIGMGSLLALLLDAPKGLRLAGSLLGGRLAAPLLLLGCLGLLSMAATPYLALSAGLTLLVGSVVVRPDHGLAWLLDHPLVRRLGVWSYAAYLVHVSALGLVRALFPNLRQETWMVFSLGVPLTFGLAALAHALVEKPFWPLRERLRAERPRAVLSASSSGAD